MNARHEHSPSFKNQRNRGESCSKGKRRNGDSDGSELLARRMVGLRSGMLLLLAEGAQQDGRMAREHEEHLRCTI